MKVQFSTLTKYPGVALSASKVLGLGWTPPLHSCSGNSNDRQICRCNSLLVKWANSIDVSSHPAGSSPLDHQQLQGTLSSTRLSVGKHIVLLASFFSTYYKSQFAQISVIQWGLSQDYSQDPKDSWSPSCLLTSPSHHLSPRRPAWCWKHTGTPQIYCRLGSRHHSNASIT